MLIIFCIELKWMENSFLWSFMRKSERVQLWMSSASADKRRPSHWTVLLIKKVAFQLSTSLSFLRHLLMTLLLRSFYSRFFVAMNGKFTAFIFALLWWGKIFNSFPMMLCWFLLSSQNSFYLRSMSKAFDIDTMTSSEINVRKILWMKFPFFSAAAWADATTSCTNIFQRKKIYVI